MWSRVLEWCADAFGATKRKGWIPFVAALIWAATTSTFFGFRRGFWEAIVPLALVLIAFPYVAQGVIRARDELWRAACLELDDPRQQPILVRSGRPLLAPTAVALGNLAFAVDLARRGSLSEASELLPQIARPLLRDDEIRLLEAVRALISLGLGDGRRAAQQAVLALPSGSEAIDVALGRAVLVDAWSDTKRLAAIDAAWDREGVGLALSGPLPRLRVLVKLRVAGGDVSTLGPAEARDLASEAESIGDRELAADLEMHARSGSYR